MYVCICHGISDRHLKQVLQEGAASFEELQAKTGVSTCCGACESTARAIVEEACPRRCETRERACATS
ncbi:MAG: (2Fe-2S)-binding protein [Steroidobacteraceae bacterium]|jgi:bacterioferritin-associated ferredoxin|nr:(2Fe-2S)-binding protein [Steroidobacteraceae bacterium]